MKIHLQRFLLILFLLPFFASANHRSSFRKNKNMKPTLVSLISIGKSTGKIWLQIDKLDEEILYQTSLPAGLGSNEWLDRGILGTTYIVKFNRVGIKF
jgi:hypothetical protein